MGVPGARVASAAEWPLCPWRGPHEALLVRDFERCAESVSPMVAATALCYLGPTAAAARTGEAPACAVAPLCPPLRGRASQPPGALSAVLVPGPPRACRDSGSPSVSTAERGTAPCGHTARLTEDVATPDGRHAGASSLGTPQEGRQTLALCPQHPLASGHCSPRWSFSHLLPPVTLLSRQEGASSSLRDVGSHLPGTVPKLRRRPPSANANAAETSSVSAGPESPFFK